MELVIVLGICLFGAVALCIIHDAIVWRQYRSGEAHRKMMRRLTRRRR